MSDEWRFIATRLLGDGTEARLDPNVPLRDVSFTEYRNAPTTISASLNPEMVELEDAAGLPVLRQWSTCIYLEKAGEIPAGGILVDDALEGPSRTLDFMGMAGYPNGQPYTEASTWPANPPIQDLDPDATEAPTEERTVTVAVPYTTTVYNKKTKTTTSISGWRQEQQVQQVPIQFAAIGAPNNQGAGYPVDGLEPMTAIREIWRHLQAQQRGNIGMVVDGMDTGKKIGKVIAVADIDTENGPLTLEYDPFTLRWYETHDLGEVIDNLCQNLPLEFREVHSWNADRTAITHFLKYGHPGLGQRRNGPSDPHFIVGENVEPVGIDPPADEYASHVIGIGAGEGPTMPRADAIRDDEDRIRRAIVFEDKAAKTAAAIAVSARAELLEHIAVDEVTQISVIPGQEDEVRHYMPGDTVWLAGEQAHRDVAMWVRIESKTTYCSTDRLEFGVTRVDRLA